MPLCPFISLSGKGTKGQNRMAWDPGKCWPLQLGDSAIAHSLLVLHADSFLMGYQEYRSGDLLTVLNLTPDISKLVCPSTSGLKDIEAWLAYKRLFAVQSPASSTFHLSTSEYIL